MSTEIATIRPSSGSLALHSDQQAWTDMQRAALAQIGVDEAPEADQAVLLHVSQRTGLDPFSRQIYLIGRYDGQAGGKKWTIQTGIDGFRIIAERHHQYAGQLEPEWCGDDGVWRDVWCERKPPVAARVGVLRHDWPRPVYATCHFTEFAQYNRNGELNAMWRQKGAHQIAKCAEAGALRKAFPQDLSGLYTDDEMAHVDNPTRVAYDHHDTGSARRVTAADIVAEPDWDARIAEREQAGDRDGLAELWRQGKARRPNDTELLARIAAAAERIKMAQQEATTVDGEVADDAPEPTAEPEPEKTSTPAKDNGALPTVGSSEWHDDGHPEQSGSQVVRVPQLLNGDCGYCEEDAAGGES